MDAGAVKKRLQSHPDALPEADALSRCIAATLECAQSCAVCADACLAEKDADALARCIRLDLDCADVCDLTGRMLSRQYEPDMQLLRAAVELCSKACDACATECEAHADHHEHCRLCAQTCRDCQQACTDLLTALA
jgi:hypothetical protein